MARRQWWATSFVENSPASSRGNGSAGCRALVVWPDGTATEIEQNPGTPGCAFPRPRLPRHDRGAGIRLPDGMGSRSTTCGGHGTSMGGCLTWLGASYISPWGKKKFMDAPSTTREGPATRRWRVVTELERSMIRDTIPTIPSADRDYKSPPTAQARRCIGALHGEQMPVIGARSSHWRKAISSRPHRPRHAHHGPTNDTLTPSRRR